MNRTLPPKEMNGDLAQEEKIVVIEHVELSPTRPRKRSSSDTMWLSMSQEIPIPPSTHSILSPLSALQPVPLYQPTPSLPLSHTGSILSPTGGTLAVMPVSILATPHLTTQDWVIPSPPPLPSPSAQYRQSQSPEVIPHLTPSQPIRVDIQEESPSTIPDLRLSKIVAPTPTRPKPSNPPSLGSSGTYFLSFDTYSPTPGSNTSSLNSSGTLLHV